MSVSFQDAVDDLVLQNIIGWLHAADALRSCSPVNRRWLRLTRNSRHVALHLLDVMCRPLLADLRRISQADAHAWLRDGRLVFFCQRLARAEWCDDSEEHVTERSLSAADRVAECKTLHSALKLLDVLLLEIAVSRHQDLADGVVVQAVLFFLRPRFDPLMSSEPFGHALCVVVNLAALPGGRAMLFAAKAHETLLSLVESNDASVGTLNLAMSALANMALFARCRDALLEQIARIAARLRVLLTTEVPARRTVRQLGVTFQALRFVRELVGKADAALIAKSVGAIEATGVLEVAFTAAFSSVGGKRDFDSIALALALCAELGRAAVRPKLAAKLLVGQLDVILNLFETQLTSRSTNEFECLYVGSVCFAQAVLVPDFRNALTPAQLSGCARVGEAAFVVAWPRNGTQNEAVRIALALLHLARFSPVVRDALGRLAEADRPMTTRFDMLVAAAQLLAGKITAERAKQQLRSVFEAVSACRAKSKLAPLSFSQFVQQCPVWIETPDVFCTEPALRFEAEAFDSLESVGHLHRWIVRAVEGAEQSIDTDLRCAAGGAVFKVARQLPRPRTTLDELSRLCADLALRAALAYRLSPHGMIATWIQTLQ
jgi:hypothetical protein